MKKGRERGSFGSREGRERRAADRRQGKGMKRGPKSGRPRALVTLEADPKIRSGGLRPIEPMRAVASDKNGAKIGDGDSVRWCDLDFKIISITTLPRTYAPKSEWNGDHLPQMTIALLQPEEPIHTPVPNVVNFAEGEYYDLGGTGRFPKVPVNELEVRTTE